MQNLYWDNLIVAFSAKDYNYIDKYIEAFFSELNLKISSAPSNIDQISFADIKYLFNKKLDLFENNLIPYFCENLFKNNGVKSLVIMDEQFNKINNNNEDNQFDICTDPQEEVFESIIKKYEYTKKYEKEENDFDDKIKVYKKSYTPEHVKEFIFDLINQNNEFIHSKLKFGGDSLPLYKILASLKINKNQQTIVNNLLNDDPLKKSNFLLALFVNDGIKFDLNLNDISLLSKFIKGNLSDLLKVRLFSFISSNKKFDKKIFSNDHQILIDHCWLDILNKSAHNKEIIDNLELCEEIIAAYQENNWLIPDEKLLAVIKRLEKTYQKNESVGLDEEAAVDDIIQSKMNSLQQSIQSIQSKKKAIPITSNKNINQNLAQIIKNQAIQYHNINHVSKVVKEYTSPPVKLPIIFEKIKLSVATANAAIKNNNNDKNNFLKI